MAKFDSHDLYRVAVSACEAQSDLEEIEKKHPWFTFFVSAGEEDGAPVLRFNLRTRGAKELVVPVANRVYAVTGIRVHSDDLPSGYEIPAQEEAPFRRVDLTSAA
jgi:hypothetical protein